MIEKKDVEKLAALARITIPEAQIENVRKDIDAILAYVGQIKEATEIAEKASQKAQKDQKAQKSTDQNQNSLDGLLPSQNYDSGVKNVMREDGVPHETGIYTDILLDRAPKTEGDYIKVKKILQ